MIGGLFGRGRRWFEREQPFDVEPAAPAEPTAAVAASSAGAWERPDAPRGTTSGADLPAKVLVPDRAPERPAARTEQAEQLPVRRVESPEQTVDRIDAQLEENLRVANQQLRAHLRQAEAMLAIRDGVSVHDLVVPWPKQTPRPAPR